MEPEDVVTVDTPAEEPAWPLASVDDITTLASEMAESASRDRGDRGGFDRPVPTLAPALAVSTDPDVDARLRAAESALAASNARFAHLEGALRGGGGEPVTASSIAQAFTQATATQRAQWETEQRAARELAPPSLTDDEKARILSDPDLLVEKMRQFVGHGYRVAMAQLVPRLQQGEIMYQLGQPSVDLLAEVSIARASKLAVDQGMSEEEFESLREPAFAVIRDAAAQTQNPDLNYTRMALSPQTFLAAAQHVRATLGAGNNNGDPVTTTPTRPTKQVVPVDPQRRATSIGGATTHADRRPPVQRPAQLTKMEARLGKFTTEELRAAAEKAKTYDQTL
jgi:hypothetical protein